METKMSTSIVTICNAALLFVLCSVAVAGQPMGVGTPMPVSDYMRTVLDDPNSTTARSTLDAQKQHMIDVTEAPYNATGDGVTDDTAAIQAAIKAANGVPVILPPGDYRVTSRLEWDDLLILQGVSGNAFASQEDSTYPVAIHCYDVNDYLFKAGGDSSNRRIAISGIVFWGSSAGRSANAADCLAGASPTWKGLLDTSEGPQSAHNIWLDRVSIFYSASETPAINLTRAFWSELNRVRIGYWLNHIGLYADNSGMQTQTTLTVNKSYIHYCRQAFHVGRITTVVFRDTVFEASVVAGTVHVASTLFDACHFEMIGYDITQNGRTEGITPKGFGTWNAELPGGVTAGVTVAYAPATFNNCHFQSVSGSKKWFQSIGRPTSYRLGGRVVFNECTVSPYNAEFFDDTYKYTVEWEWNGRLSHCSTLGTDGDLSYADLRKLNRGRVVVPFAGDSQVRYSASINAGRFVYDGMDMYALTAPPAGHPEDGQNEAGDKVVLREPDESGVLEYVCVEAGEPGTWSAGHTWTAD